MRTFVSSDEIAHLWAHQTKPSAKCSSSMSFDGPKFYSYGVVIGEIVTSKDGQTVFLLTETGGYSQTTSTHQNIMRDAVPHSAVSFTVPGVSQYSSDRFSDNSRILAAWTSQAENLLTEANEAKRDVKKVRLMGEAAQIVVEMRRFAEVMGVKKPALPVIPGNPGELADALKREADRKKRLAAAAAKKAEKCQAEAMAQWLAGADVGTFNLGLLPVALRVIGDNVETSRGVRFPLAHARRGLKLVDSVVASGKPWHTNGHTLHLGPYQVEEIAPDGTVTAGCHIVTLAAIDRIRPQLMAAAA